MDPLGIAIENTWKIPPFLIGDYKKPTRNGDDSEK
jgi:hypothetical protein